MRALKFNFILLAFISFLLLSPGTASARSRFFIGFGTSFGHGHPGLHRGHYPRYGWRSGYYGWLDHDRYYWMDRGRYRSFYGSWPWYSSGTTIWIDNGWPLWAGPPLVGHPRVINRKMVSVRPQYYQYKPGYNENTSKLFDKLRQKKSELLKTLKIGDKANRTKAIAELVGFSFDDNVRKALEHILLKDPDPDLRKEVAKSLAKVKNRKVIPALEKARIADSDKQVREEADKAIKKIKGY